MAGFRLTPALRRHDAGPNPPSPRKPAVITLPHDSTGDAPDRNTSFSYGKQSLEPAVSTAGFFFPSPTRQKYAKRDIHRPYGLPQHPHPESVKCRETPAPHLPFRRPPESRLSCATSGPAGSARTPGRRHRATTRRPGRSSRSPPGRNSNSVPAHRPPATPGTGPRPRCPGSSH